MDGAASVHKTTPTVSFHMPTTLSLTSAISAVGLLWIATACAPAEETPSPSVDSDTSPEDTGSPPETSDPLTLRAEIASDQLSKDLERTRHNPLKGFLTSYKWATPSNDLSDQMEFLYIPMDSVWTENGADFDSELEPFLEAAEGRGHHVVLRLYIDYPNLPSGLPDHLSDRVPCEPYDHFGPGCSPDYDHPELLSAMVGLIEALGARYDGDRRIGFIQVGLIGFWGEWHTYPYSEWFPSEATQESVLNAYDTSFKTTQLQIRRPAANSVSLRMGFHDDSFAYSTIGDESWFFLPGLESAGADQRWQEVAIGGELRPELQETAFSDRYTEGDYAQDPLACIEQTHASYLLNYRAFSGNNIGYEGDQLLRAEEAALAMGYTFEVREATMEATVHNSGEADVSLKVLVAQTGIAPFYYPLSVEAVSLRFDHSASSATSLQGLLPGQTEEILLEFEGIPEAALYEPFALSLDSPILQDSQSIAWATQTPWTAENGPLLLQWSPEPEPAP